MVLRLWYLLYALFDIMKDMRFSWLVSHTLTVQSISFDVCNVMGCELPEWTLHVPIVSIAISRDSDKHYISDHMRAECIVLTTSH